MRVVFCAECVSETAWTVILLPTFVEIFAISRCHVHHIKCAVHSTRYWVLILIIKCAAHSPRMQILSAHNESLTGLVSQWWWKQWWRRYNAIYAVDRRTVTRSSVCTVHININTSHAIHDAFRWRNRKLVNSFHNSASVGAIFVRRRIVVIESAYRGRLTSIVRRIDFRLRWKTSTEIFHALDLCVNLFQ